MSYQRLGVTQHVVLQELVQLVEATVLDQGVDDQLVQVVLEDNIQAPCSSRLYA